MAISNSERLGERVQKVFNETQKIVDSLADGERKQIKDIVTEVVKATGEDTTFTLGFVSYFAHNIEPEAHVRRGKKGGLVKGARKVVAPKSVKVVKAAQSNDENTVVDTAVQPEAV